MVRATHRSVSCSTSFASDSLKPDWIATARIRREYVCVNSSQLAWSSQFFSRPSRLARVAIESSRCADIIGPVIVSQDNGKLPVNLSKIFLYFVERSGRIFPFPSRPYEESKPCHEIASSVFNSGNRPCFLRTTSSRAHSVRE